MKSDNLLSDQNDQTTIDSFIAQQLRWLTALNDSTSTECDIYVSSEWNWLTTKTLFDPLNTVKHVTCLSDAQHQEPKNTQI